MSLMNLYLWSFDIQIVKSKKVGDSTLRMLDDLITFDAVVVDDLRRIVELASSDIFVASSITELTEKLRESSAPCAWCTPPRLPLDGRCTELDL